MKVLDLFSGIGGFSLGLERAGMRTVAFCEKDEFCQKVLRKHWPDVQIHEDIRTLDGRQYHGTVDLICGGFPCQPFSNAGRRRGTADDRHLWPEMFRIIDEAKPTWVIGENVAGIGSMAWQSTTYVESRSIIKTAKYDFYEAIYLRKEIMLLNRICEELEYIGYEVIPLVIPACAVDAPHRRDRVWILAHTKHPRQNFTTQQGSDRETICSSKERQNRPGKFKRMDTPTFMADTNHEGLEKRQSINSHARKECPSLERNSWWAIEPAVGRVADGISDRVDRLKALGNAVVPQIVEEIGRAILATTQK